MWEFKSQGSLDQHTASEKNTAGMLGGSIPAYQPAPSGGNRLKPTVQFSGPIAGSPLYGQILCPSRLPVATQVTCPVPEGETRLLQLRPRESYGPMEKLDGKGMSVDSKVQKPPEL